MLAANISRCTTPNVSPKRASPVGTCGDSYDNALADTVIGLCKMEVIYNDGLWKSFDHVEYATLE